MQDRCTQDGNFQHQYEWKILLPGFVLISQFLTPKMTLLRYPYLRLPKFASSSTIFHLSPFLYNWRFCLYIYMTESDICAFPLPFFKRHIYGWFLSYWHSLHRQTLLMLFDRQLPLSCIFCSFLIEKIITILLFGACCYNFLNYLLKFWKKLSIIHQLIWCLSTWHMLTTYMSNQSPYFKNNCQSFFSWLGAIPPVICSTPTCHITINTLSCLNYIHQPFPTCHIPIHIPMSITFL